MDTSRQRGSFKLEACIRVNSLVLCLGQLMLNAPCLAIGVIGATVMPHSLFIGSALATQDRLSTAPLKDDSVSNSSLGSLPEERRPRGILDQIKLSLRKAFQIKALDGHRTRPQRHEDRENNSYRFVESHVYHGIVDIVLSLLGIAVVINSM